MPTRGAIDAGFRSRSIAQLAESAGAAIQRLDAFFEVIQHADVARLDLGERLPDLLHGVRVEDEPIAALPAVIEAHLVSRDPDHPCHEGPRVVVGREGIHEGDRHLLQDVVPIADLPDQRPDERRDRRLRQRPESGRFESPIVHLVPEPVHRRIASTSNLSLDPES